MKNEHKIMSDFRHNISQKSRPISHPSQQKSPQLNHSSTSVNSLRRKPVKNMDFAKSPAVQRFAPHPKSNSPALPSKPTANIPQKPLVKPAIHTPAPHPIAQTIQQQKPIVIDNSAKAIKETAIAEAFQKITERQNREKESIKKRHKTVRIIIFILSIICIGLYLFYINLPVLSVSLASAKSGFEASLPSYIPSSYERVGYTYINGSDIVVDYKSDDKTLCIKQSKSDWDSSAVKNMVDEKSAGKFNTTEYSGLTIFYYDDTATWVNGGILYTISSNAQLDIGEIRQIALSF